MTERNGEKGPARIVSKPVWSDSWDLGDGLFWRTPEGDVNAVVLTEVPEFGPKGARRSPGALTHIEAVSLVALNDALHELGFESTDLTNDDIKVIEERQAVERGKPRHRSRNFTLGQISDSHRAALERKRRKAADHA